MSLKTRRFSLDSNMDEGQLGVTQRGNYKLRKKSRQSLDEGRLDIQELNHKLMPLREQTIAEETLERSDGVIKANSFIKHNKTFHKLFPETPEEEKLTHTFACALQKEVLYHGKLFVSENHVCFYSSVLLKDTKVLIPASSIQEVKKHKTAVFMLTLQTTDGEKFSFASLRNRDMCYRLLQSLCSSTQESSTSSSPRLSPAEMELEQDMQMPSCSSLDLSRQSSFSLDEESPLLARNGRSRLHPRGQVSSADESHGAESLRTTETSFFYLGNSGKVGVLFTIYLVLTVLLLLVSGYVGMRIVALEEQLNTLGTLTEFSVHTNAHSRQTEM